MLAWPAPVPGLCCAWAPGPKLVSEHASRPGPSGGGSGVRPIGRGCARPPPGTRSRGPSAAAAAAQPAFGAQRPLRCPNRPPRTLAGRARWRRAALLISRSVGSCLGHLSASLAGRQATRPRTGGRRISRRGVCDCARNPNARLPVCRFADLLMRVRSECGSWRPAAVWARPLGTAGR